MCCSRVMGRSGAWRRMGLDDVVGWMGLEVFMGIFGRRADEGVVVGVHGFFVFVFFADLNRVGNAGDGK